ncbi:MAG: hypothetical protein JHC95_19380 [Solirubrobacteraceae bacterium]|nr:hypothetical protein [Solirubrobacteraceae bacterium]
MSQKLSALALTTLATLGMATSAQAAQPTKTAGKPTLVSALRDTVKGLVQAAPDSTNAVGVTAKSAVGNTTKTLTSVLQGKATPTSVVNETSNTVSHVLGTTSAVVGTVTKTLGAGLIKGQDCGQSLGQPFLNWGDETQYTLVPGGNFENGLDGWTTSGGATVVGDQEPWRVGGSSDSKAVYLPAGSSITSPPVCGGLTHPTLRLFTKGGKLPLVGGARVDVLYPGKDGLLVGLSLGVITPNTEWTPTQQILTLSGLPILTGGTIALRISATGAPVTVDDLYVDPMRFR